METKTMTRQEFKQARLDLGMTQEQIAAAVGVSSGRTVRRWESGERNVNPSASILAKILLGGKEAQSQNI
jgi:transcriptional regulator with XRE-family HTH domain